jgi:hypothetical protein
MNGADILAVFAASFLATLCAFFLLLYWCWHEDDEEDINGDDRSNRSDESTGPHP